jgi:hypothetical protein
MIRWQAIVGYVVPVAFFIALSIVLQALHAKIFWMMKP